MLFFWKNLLSNVCLSFFGADVIFAHAKAWDLVLWKCPRHSMTLRSSASTFYTSNERFKHTFKLLKCAFISDSDIWTGCFTIIFAGSLHYFKPVSCWILLCENVSGVPRPFDQLPLHVGKVNTFKTPGKHLYLHSDVLGEWLTIIFVGSFPYF